MLRALSPAPFVYFFSVLPPPSSLPNRSLHRFSPMAVFARIAVVGDVHGDWDLREDTKALQLLQRHSDCIPHPLEPVSPVCFIKHVPDEKQETLSMSVKTQAPKREDFINYVLRDTRAGRRSYSKPRTLTPQGDLIRITHAIRVR
ncbi:hypothetical protein SDJN02_17896 [Cucurbita argyrosperma subsp. argyrosperma]|nr:hypothetical protein SDJN02_17896 [Cucurbita argyrosperma subsp. argyrosperma]